MHISVIMPIYNVEHFVGEAIQSVLNQTFKDFELLIIDDCSPDSSIDICRSFKDSRIRLISHDKNRGLAGARNTGIRHATGELLAFIDSDDRWHPNKLQRHVEHLAQRPEVGLSFSRSEFMNEQGKLLGCYQMPKLKNITADYLFARNPVGNGSAPVLRRSTLDAIAFETWYQDIKETNYFDSSLRQSEDIECWVRIMLQTDWKIEGIPEVLTHYRLNSNSLSASILKQLGSWERMVQKTQAYAPAFVDSYGRAARAYQLRYLSRQAIRLYDGHIATQLAIQALKCDWQILAKEPSRSSLTIVASLLLKYTPNFYQRIEKTAISFIGLIQTLRINTSLPSCRPNISPNDSSLNRP